MKVIKQNYPLTLYTFAEGLLKGHTVVWFVGNNPTSFLRYEINIKNKNKKYRMPHCYTDLETIISSFDVLKVYKIILDHMICKLSTFCEKHFYSGHFFFTKGNALKYMYQRILYIDNDTISKAKEYVEQHPECLI